MAHESHFPLATPSKKIADFINSWNFEVLVVAPLAILVLAFIAYRVDPEAISATLAALVVLSPLWLPIYLFNFFWVSWMEYIRYMYWFSEKFVLLEVQLPPEVAKSPKAMELFITDLYKTGSETTFMNRIWQGSYRPIWSLEIASNEGRIGFYIRMKDAWRSIIEAQLYGQFPEAKVFEVEDYAAKIPFNLEEYDIFGEEATKGSPNAAPIKTYVDFGLDKDPDEELKVDPITNVLELIGQVGPGEHFWFQIVLKGHKQDEWYGFYENGDNPQYRQDANAEIKKIMKGASDRAKAVVEEIITDAEQKKQAVTQAAARGISQLTEGEREKISAIERWLTKQVFECGIRVVYLYKRENEHGINKAAVIRFFDSFKGQFNGLGITRGTIFIDYPWQDFMHIRSRISKRHLFFAYKNRAYFYVPYDQKPIYLNTEELATLWHFPSSVVKTPGLNRVPSRLAEAPPNLPTLPS